MKKFWYLPIVLWTMGMVGCSNEEELVAGNESLVQKKCDKIEVTFEKQDEESRAILQDNGSIFWEKDDEINVYVEHGPYYYDKYEDTYISETEKQWVTYRAETSGSNTGVFVSEVEYPDIPEYKWEKQLAFYGMKNESWNTLQFVTWDESSKKINFSIDTTPENPFVMASLIEPNSQNNIKLYNAGAIMKVEINNMPDDAPYYELELEAGNVDDNYRQYGLWGDCEITFDEEGKPIWKILPTEDGTYNSVITQLLREEDDPLVGKCKSTFYFTIPPADYQGGLTLRLRGTGYDNEGNPLGDYTLGTLKDVTGGLKVDRNDYIIISFDYVDYVDATNENIATAFERSNYVRLYEDVKLTSDLVLDKVGEEIILDLNGHMLIIADGASLTNKANLKIRNGEISPGSSKTNLMNYGDISLFNVMFSWATDGSAEEPSYALFNKGKASLSGIKSGAYHIFEGIVNEGEMTIAKGDYYTGGEYCIYNQNPEARLTIYEGHFEACNGILTSNGAQTTIYNGHIKASDTDDSHAITLMGTTSKVIIENGIFDSHGLNCIYNANTDIASFLDERILIKGGKFSYKYDGYGIKKWDIADNYFIPILK